MERYVTVSYRQATIRFCRLSYHATAMLQDAACDHKNRKSRWFNRSPNEHDAVFQELVLRNLEIVGGRATSDTAATIVMRAVTRAEPPMIVTRIGNWHATEMGAHSQANHPLRHIK
jgi:hypothetical protein